MWEGVSYVLFITLTIAQMALIDYYFIHYMKDHRWLGWIAGDIIVVIVMIWLLILAIRYNHRYFRRAFCDDANIRYAWLVWCIYSLLLSAKIAGAMFTFADKLTLTGTFGLPLFKLILSLAAGVFLLLVLSHHYTKVNSPRQTYLAYLETGVTLDILDSINFLDLVFEERVRGQDLISPSIEIVIISFAALNFFLPTFALLKLRSHKLPHWFRIEFPAVYTLCYFLFVNVPYLVIRSYLWQRQGTDVSNFMVKNVIMIFLGIRELWLSYLKHRHRNSRPDAFHDGTGLCIECPDTRSTTAATETTPH